MSDRGDEPELKGGKKMGTYLRLELKDKSPRGIARANALWAYENQDGYQDTVEFRSEQDTLTDIEYIKLDPGQEHLRIYDAPEKLAEAIIFFGLGTFQVKITLGDYLCSEMARRYIGFIEKHRDLFTELSDDYVMSILREKAETNEKAEDCLVNCPFCKKL